MKFFRFKNFPGILLVLTVLIPTIVSCNRNSGEVEYIPVQLREDGSWTFIDAQGKRIGNQEWEFEPSVTKGGIFVAKGDNGLNIYRWKGDKAEPIDSLQDLVSVGVYNEGLLPVTPKMKRIRIVNGKGKVRFELLPIDGKEISSCSPQFSDGMLVVRTTDYKTGVVDRKGNVVFAPKYSDISDFKDGYALAVDYNNDNSEDGPLYYILDKKGAAMQVKGKFGYGYGEDECAGIPSFENGYAYVMAATDAEKDETPSMIQIATDGSTKKIDGYHPMSYLNNGGCIEVTYEDDETISKWTDKKGELIKKFDSYVYSIGKYAVKSEEDAVTLYSEDGQEFLKKSGASSAIWPGGKFGPILYEYDSDTSKSSYSMFDSEGKPLQISKIYGVGTQETIPAYSQEAEGDCGGGVWAVTSAYVDITAAAAKIVSMAEGNVDGKKNYYLGEPVKDILGGDKASYYSYSGNTFTIPTGDTGQIASGEGFWINGSAVASANIVAPTYETYFEVYYYDYWGTPWGQNRKRQVGVHFNSSAKVTAFNIQLHTNHPSGSQLREAITRRMKKEGYTLVSSEPNYDEYTRDNTNVLIYGNAESNGVGAYIGTDNVAKMKESEKSALAASLY